jgi:hypothetical protein
MLGRQNELDLITINRRHGCPQKPLFTAGEACFIANDAFWTNYIKGKPICPLKRFHLHRRSRTLFQVLYKLSTVKQ